MWIVTSQEMKQIEARAVEYGHSYEGMMENAGAAAASYIRQTLGVENRRCVCICGSGNNGGDGFVVARRLLHKGAQVAVILASGAPKTGQAQAMLEQVRAIDKRRLRGYIGKLTKKQMELIDQAARVGLGLGGDAA